MSSLTLIIITAAILLTAMVVCAGNGCFARFKDGRLVQEGDCENADDHPIFEELKAKVEMRWKGCFARFKDRRMVQKGDCENADHHPIFEELKAKAELKSNNQFDFDFSQPDHLDYVQYLGQIPELNEFTICAWVAPVFPGHNVTGTLVSYCVPGTKACNTIFVQIHSDGKVSFVLENSSSHFTNGHPIESRSHVCFVMSAESGNVYYYINATEPQKVIKSVKRIPQGGVLITGQDQDGNVIGTTPGEPHQSNQGFFGLIEDFRLWNRAFNISEIQSLHASPCFQQNNAITSFNSTNARLKGHVTAIEKEGCRRN